MRRQNRTIPLHSFFSLQNLCISAPLRQNLILQQRSYPNRPNWRSSSARLRLSAVGRPCGQWWASSMRCLCSSRLSISSGARTLSVARLIGVCRTARFSSILTTITFVVKSTWMSLTFLISPISSPTPTENRSSRHRPNFHFHDLCL